MKKHLLLGILMCVFSVQFLSAQTCQQPAKVLPSPGVKPSSGLTSGPTGQAISGGCTPSPTPDPNPTPTPTPTPTPVTGFVGPKYVVLAVTYAPPGSGSSVVYSNSNLLGTSIALTNTFTSTTTQNTMVGGGIKINLVIFTINIGGSSTSSNQFTQEADTSSSVEVKETTTLSTTIPGPSSSAVGLNHDVDIIWVWLNPLMNFTVNSSNSLTWTGFSSDGRDPAGSGEMDIIGISVAYLNGHQAMPANIADVLARRWSPRIPCDSTDPFCGADGTEDPGLNANDLAAILQADPFANPNYVINIPSGSNCTADGRFCRTTNQTLQYVPPPAGGQPVTQSYSMMHQTTDTAGQSASDSRQVGFGSDLNASANPPQGSTDLFTISFNADLKKSKTLTTTNKWSATSTDQVGQTAMVTVKGPASTDNYTGPVEFEVFQDNIYGTFMFGFIPAPTFSLFASPASQSVVQGNCTSYTASVSALVSGFSSTVNFSLGSALPANATASFSPASVTGAGSSTLTVCTAASTPLATSNITINATSGIEVHTTSVSLTVNAPPPPPDFSLSASPASLAITTIPGSATSTITVSPVSGFTSPVSLSVNGGGLAASLSATSVNGSGSVTLTVQAGTTIAAGSYTVTVTGTSGTLSHSVQIPVSVSSGGGGGGGGGGGCRTCPIP
ncbi:MAG TPA: hypothetical protein VFR24_17810 [Candidatus Angelobacter sp.]|nr:hypothetical protein [Candidatus Angelobacter sp.]